MYKDKGKIVIYSPRVGSLQTTLSGRLNIDRLYKLSNGEEAAKFLFSECARNYSPSLIYQVPKDHMGTNLDNKVLGEIKNCLRSIIDDKRKEVQMNVRPKIITKQKGNSRERFVRIRRREKISIET